MDNSDPATDGLVLHLSFDSLDGDTCPDLSPMENDGTNYGADHVQSFEWNVTSATPTTPHFTSLPDPVVTPTMLIEWNESTCVDAAIDFYTIHIDTTDSFPDPTSYTVENTSIEVSGLTNGTYYTRIKSTNEYASQVLGVLLLLL
ncbi:MAG: hypothetical protein BAJATHORv1_60095 [Candidatus Thorarchaeota archaeon]|nr:MAG: hypothetical protein BAJATHORv1_60095 [Candidatus Thorarchaeota archaeon]